MSDRSHDVTKSHLAGWHVIIVTVTILFTDLIRSRGMSQFSLFALIAIYHRPITLYLLLSDNLKFYFYQLDL